MGIAERATKLLNVTTAPLAAPAIFDITARKTHQWTMVVLIGAGFVLGEPFGWVPLAVAGTIMLAGRFWWPADVVRQFVWRVAEPAGWLPRIEREEDHETRRIARILGGTIWLISAALILLGQGIIAWILAALIAVMVALDASVDFCALCFLMKLVKR